MSQEKYDELIRAGAPQLPAMHSYDIQYRSSFFDIPPTVTVTVVRNGTKTVRKHWWSAKMQVEHDVYLSFAETTVTADLTPTVDVLAALADKAWRKEQRKREFQSWEGKHP